MKLVMERVKRLLLLNGFVAGGTQALSGWVKLVPLSATWVRPAIPFDA